MKIDPAVFRFIEHELYQYYANKKKLELYHEGAIGELNPAFVRHLERSVTAIDRALMILGEEKYIDLFWLKYQNRLTWGEVAAEMDIAERTFYRLRKNLVVAVGQQLGLLNVC